MKSVLIKNTTVENWKHFHNVEIKPELVNIIQIDLEDCSKREDELLSDKCIVKTKRITFVAKLNEGKPIQIEYTCEDWGEWMLELIVPADYYTDSLGCVCKEKVEFLQVSGDK